MKYTDIIKGNYYYCEWDDKNQGNWVIFKANENGTYEVISASLINYEGSFHSSFPLTIFGTLRDATPNEAKHLDMCIEAGEYMVFKAPKDIQFPIFN